MRSLPAALLLSAAALTACGTSGTASSDTASDGRLTVAAGFYPYAFLAERIGGDAVEVVDLAGPGVEPHDLELTASQVATVSESDLVVYSRGFQPALDEAVDQQADDRALDVLGTVELRPAGEHSDEEGEVHEGEEEGDPHVWLDPVRYAAIGQAVADRLAEVAPDRAEEFTQRADALEAELTELDGELRAGLTGCERDDLVTSHDAFGYLAAAYGLEQVSLTGLSPEDEASPARLAEVASFAQENGVTTVFFEELVSPAVAEQLAREVGATAVELSPLETAPEDGDYLSAMRDNLAALRPALGCP